MRVDNRLKDINYFANKVGLVGLSTIIFDNNLIQFIYEGAHDRVASPLYRSGLEDAICSEIQRFSK